MAKVRRKLSRTDKLVELVLEGKNMTSEEIKALRLIVKGEESRSLRRELWKQIYGR